MYIVGSDNRYAYGNTGCSAADIDANADNTVTTETVRIAPLRCSYTDCVSIEFTEFSARNAPCFSYGDARALAYPPGR